MILLAVAESQVYEALLRRGAVLPASSYLKLEMMSELAKSMGLDKEGK